MIACANRAALPRPAMAASARPSAGGLRFARSRTVSVKPSQGRYRVVPVVNSAPEGAQQEPVPEKEEDVAALAAEFKASRDKEKAKQNRRKADSTDPIATAMTRRFGMAGGLAWLGVLTFGVVSEQIKTRRENFVAERDTKEVTSAKPVTTASGVTYLDKVIGGGEKVGPGLLVAISYELSVDGEVVLDAKKRPQVVLFGRKPYTTGLCAGTEEVMSTMRAGGRRIITIPPEMAFGASGARFSEKGIVPPGATVTYDLTVQRVSIPPS
mmetsp:Transcript_32770/g.71505  ORF Transcript_32770/g.71505 Transcript_32770/m.71505 type:complete len:268 (-) Transcript_32770:214-1017(-)|eukprot:CAMPEP_0118935712 /NCGR_PEP_ID=MMETSP1169-20130426/15791_1 /TAXON_ID=36882 /ORGANISM="Pyramimonas obovata, Strain CCMP722" /LENGTH=267 /DNA_ID=CAMNT_0006878773 /DNA_START=65 /DNA_END=868 /DNA_ORIENTATION=-